MIAKTKAVFRAIGILLIVSPVLSFLMVLASHDQASGWIGLLILITTPFTLGVGLILMSMGSVSKGSDSQKPQQGVSFKSASVNPIRVIFIIGTVLFVAITLYVILLLS
jgi:hypothetical protein